MTSQHHSAMDIQPASLSDLSRIQAAYAEGRRRQRQYGTLVWPEFPDASLIAEMQAQKLFRVMEDDAMVGTFVIAYEDAAVWGDRDRGAHVYLHRIARSPSGTSRGLLQSVIDWACAHSGELQREGVRMDTAAASSQLVEYYERAGFVIVGRHLIGPDPTLPAHYHGTEVALFEMACPTSAA
jgi:ribosomal protein S18 acetylase RimI-like enzyme